MTRAPGALKVTSPGDSADRTLSPASRGRMRSLLIELGRLGQSASDALAAAIGDTELTDNLPIMVIMELDLAGPQRPRQLQRLTGLSSVQVTRLVDRLVERGVVSRTSGGVPGDGRATIVSLTPEGTRVAGLAAMGMEGHLDALRADLVAFLAHLDEAAAEA